MFHKTMFIQPAALNPIVIQGSESVPPFPVATTMVRIYH